MTDGPTWFGKCSVAFPGPPPWFADSRGLRVPVGGLGGGVGGGWPSSGTPATARCCPTAGASRRPASKSPSAIFRSTFLQSPDSRYLIVTNNGLAKPSFSVIDVASWTVKNTTALDQAWLGLAWHPDGTKLYSAGAAQNNVQEFTFADGALTRARTFALPADGRDLRRRPAVSRDGRTLYVTRVFAMTVSAIDLTTGQVVNTVTLPAEPYTCVVSPTGDAVRMSRSGGRRGSRCSTPGRCTPIMDLPTGEHPNAMVLSADGKRLFVASAGSATVWVIDTLVGGDRTDLDEPVSRTRRRRRRPTRSRCRPTARRCSSRTPTTTPSRSSTSATARAASSTASFRPAGIRPARSSAATASRSSS